MRAWQSQFNLWHIITELKSVFYSDFMSPLICSNRNHHICY